MRSSNLSVVVSLLLALTIIFTGTASAQDEMSSQQSRATAAAPTVTVSTSNERVRVASPEQAALRIEIYSESGERLYDSDFRAGSLLDFRPSDAAAALADGTHLLVVTTRDLQGGVRQRVGALKLDAGRVSVAQAGEERANPAQAKALADARAAQGVKLAGPAASVTVLDGVETQAATISTHDGREGQLTSTAGALTLRTGDVLKGEDVERVRVTEDGKVGVGTGKPEAALDVAGEIRARGGIRFDDGTLLTSASSSAAKPKSATGDDAATASAVGTGTLNRLAKWTETGGAGTLGDSALSEGGGNVVVDGANLRLSTAPTTQRETNLLYLSSSNQTTGVLAAPVPSFQASNGPFFAMRGNQFTTFAGQRGLFAISAGNVASPVGNEGSVVFQTGADLTRMIIKPDGNIGVGTTTPLSRFDVAGDVRISAAGSGLIFPDGTKLTSAAGAGGVSGTNVIAAVNDPATAGVINENRLSSNLVRFVPAAEQLSVGDANGTAPMINLRGGSTCCSGPGGHTPAFFKVFQNGSFVATGNLGIGTSPMEGKGYRTSWHTYKGAFRSGYADNEWDDANVGFFSWAGGSNSTASGLYALAFGDTNQAESTSSIVFGSGNQVKGAAGFSAGAGNRVCDTYGVALGNNARSGGPYINGKCDPETFNIRGLAAVAIGYNVTADQDHTTAMGKFASNNGFMGTFIWSDGAPQASADTFRNIANNEFAVRATGGVRFRTNLGGTTGCNLGAGSGVFSCTSSRTTKENFSLVDGNEVLAKLRKMPVSTWNYIAEGQQVRHLGPMAEDFYSAFSLGTDNKSIGVQDLAGVSLAAVKALDARTSELQTKTEELQRKTAEVEHLRAQVLTLEQRLAALEEAVRTRDQK